MPEMKPLEVAEKLESIIDYAGDTLDDALEFNLRRTVETAASLCRQIAAGEYKPVVHAQWETDEFGHKCSNCGEYTTDEQYENGDTTYCPSCGALMDEPIMSQIQDGKDDAKE